MTMFDAGDLYGWGYGHMIKILNRVFKKYGPVGLKRETKYIIQYLDFLLGKLNYISSLEGKQLPHFRPDHDDCNVHRFVVHSRRLHSHHGKDAGDCGMSVFDGL